MSQMRVHLEWLPSHSFYFWGELSNGTPLPASELGFRLFAWHADSFYGSLCQHAQWNGTSGVLLSAAQALSYFSHPYTSEHMDVVWPKEYAALTEVAPLIRAALEEGRFIPDFDAWKHGRRGWKLQIVSQDPAVHALPYIEQWVNATVEENIAMHPEVAAAWDVVLGTHPLLGAVTAVDDWEDEEDWFVSLGLREDVTPFRACIQLMEPTDDSDVWRLRVLLQDKRAQDRVFVYPPVSLPGDEPCPSVWGEHGARVDKDMRRWVRLVPWLQNSDPDVDVDASLMLRTELDANQAWSFLNEASVQLIEAGYTLFLPAWWDGVRQMRSRLKAKVRSSVGSPAQPLFGIDQALSFDWRIAVGGLVLSETEFHTLLEQKTRLVNFRGQWIQVDPAFYEQAQRSMKKVEKRHGLTLRDALEMHLLGQGGDASVAETGNTDEATRDDGIEVELNKHLTDMIHQLHHTSELPVLDPPDLFQGQLRPYQQMGFSWLSFMRRFGLGACLADDMGLGKTVQYISYLLEMQDATAMATPSLIICPTSVVGNWQKELERFAPELRVHVHYGSNRKRGGDFLATVAPTDVVITSYALSHLDEEELQSVRWHSICLDEAQNIKNAYTKQAASIRKLDAAHRIAMTGTPIENRLTELWSIFDFLNPGYLGSLRSFRERFVTPIEKTNDVALIDQVQKLVRPFLLRRLKNDPAVELDLPDKTEAKVYVSLTAEQAALYETILNDMLARLEMLSPMERRGIILATLTKLKQVCDHPAIFLKEQRNTHWSSRSTKLERLLEMVQELRAEGDSCLIFTQYVEMGHLLQTVLESTLNEDVLFLHGSLSKGKRDDLIDRFQSGQSSGVFILSLKAGGVGLNLTAANHVFHFDRWWNPAVENQATDRAYRIGQARHVQVHKFVTLGTLEERVDQMLEKKLALSEQIVGAGDQWISELSTDDLRELFTLRREWVEE